MPPRTRRSTRPSVRGATASALRLRLVFKQSGAIIARMDEKSLSLPDERGHWGAYGGRFVPETLMAPLEELTAAYERARLSEEFQREFQRLLRDYSGRPTPLFFARRLTEHARGARIYLKREDLSHTGSHKINNALGQAL